MQNHYVWLELSGKLTDLMRFLQLLVHVWCAQGLLFATAMFQAHRLLNIWELLVGFFEGSVCFWRGNRYELPLISWRFHISYFFFTQLCRIKWLGWCDLDVSRVVTLTIWKSRKLILLKSEFLYCFCDVLEQTLWVNSLFQISLETTYQDLSDILILGKVNFSVHQVAWHFSVSKVLLRSFSQKHLA